MSRMLSVAVKSIIMSVIKLNVVMLSVVMLSVFKLNVVILSVVALFFQPGLMFASKARANPNEDLDPML